MRRISKRKLLTMALGISSASAFNRAQARLHCGPYYPPGIQDCEAGIDSRIATISVNKRQNLSNWCWAACIQMVFDYYGYRVSQERIVAETYGDIVNWPAHNNTILDALNRRWTDDAGDDFYASGTSYSANPITAARDLANDMPLIIGTTGHAMVLTSLVYVVARNGQGEVKQAIVRDPWPGRGRRVLSAREWYGTNFLARIRVR